MSSCSGIVKLEAVCHGFRDLPKKIVHAKQRFPDVVQLRIGISALQQRPQISIDLTFQVFSQSAGDL